MRHYIMHNGWLCKWPKYEEQTYNSYSNFNGLVCFCVVVTTCCHMLSWPCVQLINHIYVCVFCFFLMGMNISLKGTCRMMKRHTVREGNEQSFKNSKVHRCRDAFSLPPSQKMFCLLPASIQHEGCLVYEWLSNLQHLPETHNIKTPTC